MGAPASPTLPRLRGADPVVQRWADDLVRAIETELQKLRTAAGQSAYTLTGVVASRTLDPTTATLAQAGQVLGTVITDLQKKGFIG